MQESSGMQSAAMYIFLRKGTVAYLVALRPIFEVCAREKVYKGREGKEGPMVETGGAIQYSQGDIVVDLAGGQDTTEQEGHPVGDGSRDIGGKQMEGRRCVDGDGKCLGGRRTPFDGIFGHSSWLLGGWGRYR